MNQPVAAGQSPPATVFVVDDDPRVRKVLAHHLRAAGYSVQEFVSALEFMVRPHDGPGCIVLDLEMPGMSGLELQEKLAGADYRMPIVFMTGKGDIPASVKAMKNGAVDFLMKPFGKADILAAVRMAIDKDRKQRQAGAAVAAAQRLIAALTPREHEVMVRIIAGMLNKQVGGELGISDATVKIHRGRVMAKLRVASVAELVRLAGHAKGLGWE